eukprot:6300713-Alexandrium_andersonii.AAC.1
MRTMRRARKRGDARTACNVSLKAHPGERLLPATRTHRRTRGRASMCTRIRPHPCAHAQAHEH